MVTAEAAISIAALTAVAVALLWLLALAGTQAVVMQAAREGARAAARGDSASSIRDLLAERAPGCDVDLRVDGELMTVTLTRRIAVPVPVLGHVLPGLSASASALREAP